VGDAVSSDSTARRPVDAQFDQADAPDTRGLERMLSMFMEEIRTRLDLIDTKLDRAINKGDDVHEDISVRLNRHDKDLAEHAAQITALKQSAQRRLKQRK
jgi:hypothetical protein